jgi:hypothetical protein
MPRRKGESRPGLASDIRGANRATGTIRMVKGSKHKYGFTNSRSFVFVWYVNHCKGNAAWIAYEGVIPDSARDDDLCFSHAVD